MPRAGQRILSTDFPASVGDTQSGTYQVTATGDFGAAATVDSGDYVDCGTVFIAPTSGMVVMHFQAEMAKVGSGTSTLRIGPETRLGGVLGEGSIVAAPSINASLSVMAAENSSDSANASKSGFMHVEQLTPGQVYNARLLHRGSSGTNGVVRVRSILVQPLT